MTLQLTTENEAEALKCLLANNPSNEAGTCGTDENTMNRLQRRLHGATAEEVHALIHAMETDGIITFTNMSHNEFTYDVHFLENFEKGRRAARSGNAKYIITTLIETAVAISGWLMYLFKK